MSYLVFTDDPSVHSAQEAERRGAPYWPLLQMGTFGGLGDFGQPKTSRAPGCPNCKTRVSKAFGQAAPCPSGQTLTPAGACVDLEPGSKMRKIGWTIAVATAITVIGLFAATLTLGTKGG
jgi:hypothetical protein